METVCSVSYRGFESLLLRITILEFALIPLPLLPRVEEGNYVEISYLLALALRERARRRRGEVGVLSRPASWERGLIIH